MLAISAAQFAAIETQHRKNFVHRALEHLHVFFPSVIERLGLDPAEELVHWALARAAEYGIVSEQDVCIFLDLAIVFGRDFDRRTAWAKEVLLGPGYGDPPTRLALLFQAAIRKIEAAPPPRPAEWSVTT